MIINIIFNHSVKEFLTRFYSYLTFLIFIFKSLKWDFNHQKNLSLLLFLTWKTDESEVAYLQ